MDLEPKSPPLSGWTPSISVVIPVMNGAATIGQQLEALAKQSYPWDWEVIVADNGSTDGTIGIVQQFQGRFPRLLTVDASQRPGGGYARNVGARAANGQLLIFVDDDDEVAPGYLQAMANALLHYDLVGATIDGTTLGPSWARGQQMSTAGAVVADFLPAAGGGCIGIRRVAFESVGGFDPDMLWGEDVDLCWRVQLSSYSFGSVPDAVVRYRGRGSLMAVFHQARTRGCGAVLLYLRHREKGMRRRPVGAAPRFYIGGLLWLLRVRSKADLARWAYLVGFRVGLLQASVRYRVAYL